MGSFIFFSTGLQNPGNHRGQVVLLRVLRGDSRDGALLARDPLSAVLAKQSGLDLRLSRPPTEEQERRRRSGTHNHRHRKSKSVFYLFCSLFFNLENNHSWLCFST